MHTGQSFLQISCSYFSAVNLFLKNHPRLLDLIIDQSKQRVSASRDDLDWLSHGLSDSEKMRLHLALDLWSGEGTVSALSIYQKLGKDAAFLFFRAADLI